MGKLRGCLKSRTQIFAMVLAMLGLLQANLPALMPALSPQTFGWVAFGVAMVVGILRWVTTESLERK